MGTALRDDDLQTDFARGMIPPLAEIEQRLEQACAAVRVLTQLRKMAKEIADHEPAGSRRPDR